jgi:hypothetical protein
MATTMSRLLGEISSHHFPNPPATPEEIQEFEQRVGWRLDPDLLGSGISRGWTPRGLNSGRPSAITPREVPEWLELSAA